MQLIDKITQAQTGFFKDKRHFLDIYWIIRYKFFRAPYQSTETKIADVKKM